MLPCVGPALSLRGICFAEKKRAKAFAESGGVPTESGI